MLEVATQLADGPPLVFAAIKEVQRESQRLTFAEAMRAIATGRFPAVAALYGSEDHREGRARSPRSDSRCGKDAERVTEAPVRRDGHGCAADHNSGEYTEGNQADLDLVLAFNHRLVAAIENNIDITSTIAALNPDLLRSCGWTFGLGAAELDVSFTDDALTDAAFYNAQVFQVDGELAWSSPISVRP